MGVTAPLHQQAPLTTSRFLVSLWFLQLRLIQRAYRILQDAVSPLMFYAPGPLAVQSSVQRTVLLHSIILY